jgi:hypothetical protein
LSRHYGTFNDQQQPWAYGASRGSYLTTNRNQNVRQSRRT